MITDIVQIVVRLLVANVIVTEIGAKYVFQKDGLVGNITKKKKTRNELFLLAKNEQKAGLFLKILVLKIRKRKINR